MGFIERGVDAALELTKERIKRNEDFDNFNPRPAADIKDQAEFMKQIRDGRDDERLYDRFKTCLEYFGFAWIPAHKLPRYDGRVRHDEGEWRNARLGLSFTPTDLASNFPRGPEQLDVWLKDQKMARAVSRGRMPKAELRKVRARRR
jgi:hypothetical protein